MRLAGMWVKSNAWPSQAGPSVKRGLKGPATISNSHAIVLTVRANFREKMRIEISSWNERTNYHHPRANRRYSGHPRVSTANACGRIARQTLPDPWSLDGPESGADAERLVDLHSFSRRPPALAR